MRKLWVMLLLLMVAVVAAACGGGDDEDSGDESDDTVEAVTLENATTFEATGYTISVPEGWVTEENDFGQLEMYTRAELTDTDSGAELTDEDAGFVIFPIPSADSILPEGESVASIMGAGGAIGLIPSDAETDTPEEITIDGRDAGRVEVLGVEDSDTIFYGVQVGDSIYVLVGLTQAGNISNFEGTFDAIAETVDFAE